MKLILSVFLTFLSLGLVAQEICDDAMDNDGDGLIDLNDPDCECLTIQPASLIPNPSFEEMSCCPEGESQLFCADSWIQASAPTTDYVHTCGILGNPYLGYEAPLPFPDGQGAIGFRDGKPGFENFKEYAGACLIEPLEKGECYRLDFYIGFHDAEGSEEFPMAIFAAPLCSSLPFGNGDTNFGCPTNGAGWDLVGEVVATGSNEWRRVLFEFVADEDYEAIVLGPGCAVNPNYLLDPYFYFDDLTIAKKTEFGIPFSDVSGDVCDGTVVIALESDLASNYQWYYNGVAILGETSPVLGLNNSMDEGIYNATITNDDGCFLSEFYLFEFPNLESFETLELCRGETYEFGAQTITDSGTFTEVFELGVLCDSVATVEFIFAPIENAVTEEICDGDVFPFGGIDLTQQETYVNTFVLPSGCDSIVTLDLIVNPLSETFIRDTICEGETFSLLDIETQNPGAYVTITSNQYGCDSTINIDLSVLDGLGFLNMVDTVTIDLGESADISPDSYSPDANEFTWENLGGDLLSENEFLLDQSPNGDTWYYLNIINDNLCVAKDSVLLKVIRNVKVFVPNVFTPDTQDANAAFTVGYNRSVTGFNTFLIYDRWGELVYTYEGSVDDFTGWDGLFNGKDAEQGVYTYLIEAQIKDETVEKFVGNVTLLR